MNSYYCTTCDMPVCDRCVILASDHRGHEIVELADANAKTLSKLSSVQREIQRRVEAPTCGRAEAVYEGLATLVDDAADDAVNHIEKLRRQAKAQLSSHKLKEVRPHSSPSRSRSRSRSRSPSPNPNPNPNPYPYPSPHPNPDPN